MHVFVRTFVIPLHLRLFFIASAITAYCRT